MFFFFNFRIFDFSCDFLHFLNFRVFVLGLFFLNFSNFRIFDFSGETLPYSRNKHVTKKMPQYTYM